MRFDTTIVDSRPNSGVTNSTAINALRMNSYSNKKFFSSVAKLLADFINEI